LRLGPAGQGEHHGEDQQGHADQGKGRGQQGQALLERVHRSAELRAIVGAQVDSSAPFATAFIKATTSKLASWMAPKIVPFEL
jgi:hypothetical protein